MMEKRNKLWRRQKGFFKYRARLIRLAAWECDLPQIDENGNYVYGMHWFELAKQHWTNVYRSTGTPCSCWICRGEKYDRKAYKKETVRILKESEK